MTDINRKIKVAEVITRMDWGGSPDIVRVICRHLNPQTYDIKLIIGLTRYPTQKTNEFLKEFSDRIIVIPSLRREINPIFDLLAFIKLYFLFFKEKFDIVHTHTAKAGALGRIAARLSFRPIIIHTPHGHNFYGYFGPRISKTIIIIERILGYFTDKLIALTDLERRDFIKFKVIDKKKIDLIYQGLELEHFKQIDNIDKTEIKKKFNINLDDRVIGMVCRLEPIKGPVYFVEAAVDITKNFNNTKFMIIGEGSLRKTLEKQVQALGLKDKFIFTGWCENVPEILSIMDIMVLPSLNEAVGIALIEAQASGVPVVTTKVGGIPEVVKDNQTGILVSAGDAKKIAQAINYLLLNEEKRLEMAERAKEWVSDRFKAEDMVNKISQLYQDLINKKNY